MSYFFHSIIPPPSIGRSYDKNERIWAMNRKNGRWIIVGWGAIVGLLLLSCSKTEDVKPDPAGAAGASILQSDPSPASQWACPQGVAGAKQVLITTPDGAAYCIDEREAVYAEYKQFLEAKGNDLSGQPPECSHNESFVPRLDDEQQAPYEFADCAPSQWLIDTEPDRAVNCVDFCDAWAFCDWAGKRLCGIRGADSTKVSAIDGELSHVARSTESEWFFVCSQGGTSKYPHGDTYESGTCLDRAKLEMQGDEALAVRDTSNNECRGQSPPFSDVFDMSGSVRQWVNVCKQGCYSMGGTALTGEAVACGHEDLGSSLNANFQIGIRCCADAVLVPSSP
jgi:formylglycine-generating enzyme required for sulfatase activity